MRCNCNKESQYKSKFYVTKMFQISENHSFYLCLLWLSVDAGFYICMPTLSKIKLARYGKKVMHFHIVT